MPNNPFALNKTVRALIIEEEKFLLCREQGDNYFFLPSWRVRRGEKSENALHSNIQNKLSSKINDLKYIGAISCSYQIDKYKSHQEFDLVYLIKLQSKPKLSSSEGTEYFWQEINSLTQKKVSPQILKAKLIEWFQNGKVFWASV